MLHRPNRDTEYQCIYLNPAIGQKFPAFM